MLLELALSQNLLTVSEGQVSVADGLSIWGVNGNERDSGVHARI